MVTRARTATKTKAVVVWEGNNRRIVDRDPTAPAPWALVVEERRVDAMGKPAWGEASETTALTVFRAAYHATLHTREG